MGRSRYEGVLDRYDVTLRCSGCGHQKEITTRENPKLTLPKFVCSLCGRHEPEVTVRPIWLRAFRK